MTASRIGLAALALAVGTAAQDARSWEGLVEKIGFSITEAIDRGLARAGQGFVYHIELEQDAGALVYSIDVWQGTGGVNVVLNAETGALVEQVDEPTDVGETVGACRIDLKQAIAAAVAARRGHVIDAQLRTTDGKPVVYLKLLTGGAFATVKVDGATGKVIDSPAAAAAEADFQSTFAVDRGDLAPSGKNPFFVLVPGWRLVLEGREGADAIRVVITVLDETRVVDGVECAIVEERETENGDLVEVSRNFFAISTKSNAVYYFGEEVDDYADGRVVGHGGAWQSGRDGARFGLFMPGTPIGGSRFYNEHAPRAAMDRVEITTVDETVTTPAGRFVGCVRWRETTPLEPGVEDFKAFARGIGFVQDGPLLLVEYGVKDR